MSKSDAETFFGRPEFERGKFGWAKIVQPDGSEQLYRRATTVAGYMEDKQGLIGWKSAMAAFGFVKSKSLLSALSVLDWKSDKDKVKDIVERAQSLGGGDDAADMGTAFHRVIERHVDNEVIDYDMLPDGFGDALDAFIAFSEKFGMKVEASELTVVDDAHQIAGTADAVTSFGTDVKTPYGVVKKGTGIITDWKTGTVAGYSGLKMAQQLSIYSHADPYDAGRGVRTEWPVEMNPDIGLVLKIDLEKGEVIPWWLDLKAAYEWVELSLKVAAVRTASKKAIKQAAIATSKGTNVKPGTEVDGDDDMDLEVGKLGAREVGKLITAAETLDDLELIKAGHGDVFTEAMTERWAKLKAQFDEGSGEPEAAETEKPAYDYSEEIRGAMGRAETVDQLRAVWKTYADHLSDKQKAAIQTRVDKLKEAELQKSIDDMEEAPAEPEAPTPGTETQVAMPDWMLEDEPAAEDEVKEFSVEDAKIKAAKVNNLGELRELFKSFHKAIQIGTGDPEALNVISERSGELK